MNTATETIGDRLRAKRRERDWSQAELARRSGVSQGTIGNIESGTRSSPRKLLAIAEALSVDPYWLETGRTARETFKEGVESLQKAVSGGAKQLRSMISSGEEPPPPEVDALNFEWLMQKATPRTQSELRRIIKAAVEGRLTESDVIAIAAIVDRITDREPSRS